jgi:hypothetical protein
METFIAGIALSLVSGLTLLSYRHPRFASKLLCILFALCLLLQTGYNISKWSWIAGYSFAHSSLSKTSPPIQLLTDQYDCMFYIAYVIIIALFIFCKIFPKYKDVDP